MPSIMPLHTTQSRRLLNRVRTASKAGKRKKARRIAEVWLRSFGAKRVALHMAYRRMPGHSRPDVSCLDSILERVDPWAGTDEEVLVGIRRKEDDPNDFRHTMNFGIVNRTLQYMSLLVLRELVELHPRQFALRGTHAAIEATAKAMSTGHVHAIEFDIQNWYPSFSGSKVAEILPLPRKVTRKILLGEHLNLKAGQGLIDALGCEEGDDWEPILVNEVLATAQHGLPQGSAASPLVAEALLAKTIYEIPELGVIVAYADNVLLLAKSKDDAVSMAIALRSALLTHPAGPFKPKVKVFQAGGPIYFLGHRLSVKQGQVHIEPSDCNLEKFEGRVKAQLAKLNKATLVAQARKRHIDELKRYIRSWCAAFKLTEGINERRAYWLSQVKFAAIYG